MRLRTVLLLAAFTIAAAACGASETTVTLPNTETASAPESDTATAAPVADSASNDREETAPATTADDLVDELIEDAEAAVEDMTESLEEVQAATGGGSATLTVGDQSWTFDSVLCALDGETGQDGTEFVLSSIHDGMQMYFSIDQFGHSASLNDISDFENPAVSLDSTGPYTEIVLDDKSFSGTGEFLDGTSDSFDRIGGTFSGTCP